jgi:hypothetical protein
MATRGSPKAGRSEIGRRVYVQGAACALVAYTNAPNSLGDNTVSADLTQPSLANGYAPITLAQAGWTTDTNGVDTYLDPATSADPIWICQADWGVTVNGVAMVFGATVMHFVDLAVPFVATRGKKLAITLANLLGG